jgi:hypothetical protein
VKKPGFLPQRDRFFVWYNHLAALVRH